MTSLPNHMLGACLQNYSKSKELTLDDGHDGTLLDSRGALETVGVDTCSNSQDFSALTPPRGVFRVPHGFSHTAKQLRLQVHGVERVGDLIVVGLDLSCMANGKSQYLNFCTLSSPLWSPLKSLRDRDKSENGSNCQEEGRRSGHLPSGRSSRPLSLDILAGERVVITNDSSL
jgi:hypothetical protein